MLDINNIYDNLWQGAYPPKGDVLSMRGFKLLVLAAAENQDATAYTGIDVILAPGDDDENPECLPNFLPQWLDAAKQVASRVKMGDKVLVTCMGGYNRSGFITTVALHLLTGWDGETCVKHVQQRRKYALHNLLFEEYLCENFKTTKKDDHE
jgi:protein-tyrosine phosphatase